jgi:phosphoserine phosphatase
VDAARAKAYSDSFSDLPMLEVVGSPAAVNPDRRLRRVATERGWPVLNLRDKDAVPLR